MENACGECGYTTNDLSEFSKHVQVHENIPVSIQYYTHLFGFAFANISFNYTLSLFSSWLIILSLQSFYTAICRDIVILPLPFPLISISTFKIPFLGELKKRRKIWLRKKRDETRSRVTLTCWCHLPSFTVFCVSTFCRLHLLILLLPTYPVEPSKGLKERVDEKERTFTFSGFAFFGGDEKSLAKLINGERWEGSGKLVTTVILFFFLVFSLFVQLFSSKMDMRYKQVGIDSNIIRVELLKFTFTGTFLKGMHSGHGLLYLRDSEVV